MPATASDGFDGPVPELSASKILEAVRQGKTVDYDDSGNRRVAIVVEQFDLIAVVDEQDQVVITVWRP
jgi:hypothetical protein